LSVRLAGAKTRDVGLDVTMHDGEIEIAVEIELAEEDTEGEEGARRLRESSLVLGALERRVHRRLLPKRERLLREIADRDPCAPVALEIGDVDPHAGERAPVLVVGDAARERDVAKARVALIEEEEVGTRIVRDDEIDAAVIAEVPDRDSERFSAQRGETGALRGVLIG